MSLYDFLQSHRAGQNERFTHTGLIPMIGKYFIPPERLDIFYRLYCRSLKKNEILAITEMHEDICPILVDIDFRFPESIGLIRQYNEKDIHNLVKIYFEQIYKYFDIEPSEVNAYIFEKTSPVRFQGNIKDGIHIIFPSIISSPEVQFEIRENIISLLSETQVLSNIEFKNSHDDLIDKAIISKNPWLMYGSCKHNQEAYRLTHIYNHKLVEQEHPSLGTLPKLLSIRNCENISILKKEITYKTFKKPTNVQFTNILSQDAQNAVDLVNLLDSNRADNYNDWLELGFCLHNIDKSLLSTWIEFSKVSPKFADGACDKLWKNFKDEGLTIASLYRWAKIDNPEKYKELKHNEIATLLNESLSGTNYDVACVMHSMYKHQFVNASIKHKLWYEFKNHRWQEMDKGLYLKKKISTDLALEYQKLSQHINISLLNSSSEEEKKMIELKLKKCKEMLKNVKMTQFKDKIMTECEELFYNKTFLNKLDSNTNLVGFENGVYDLDRHIFRDGLPDDYISFSTNIDYIDFDPTSEYSIAIHSFIKQVLPDQSVRKYVLLLLSSMLNGKVDEQKFHIWTGSGGNGKSKVIELFEKSFGDYCGKLPITVLTQKRGGSSSASPEIAKTKGKRFISLQEPEHNDQIHVGYMKELSGGDVIQARALYADPVEFKPQFKIILTCNQLPSIPSSDGGTWRRLRVVDFPSKFVDNPVNPGEFKKENIDSKMNAWKSTFMSMLLQLYTEYAEKGLSEPDVVQEFTKNYQKSSDCCLEFIEEHIQITNNKKDTIQLSHIMNEFRTWFREMYSDKAPGRKILKPYLEKYFGENMKSYGWKGAKLRIINENSDEDDNADNIL